LITWWDQKKLRDSKVLVVGAGAIGNEVVKNLALVGVGSITVIDMDTIEHSNLARCVFFREEHEGKFKAEVLATQAKLLNPEIESEFYTFPVQRLGIAAIKDFDIVIGALDNREARAWVNQAVRKLGGYWIDAAIEGLRGVVRTFGPEGACYECTLSEADYKIMSHRRSCALLAPEEMLSGKTPTNSTTAGIVAGVQVQEAIKFLVGQTELMALVGKCWVYTGDSMTTYVTGYQEDEFCNAHDRYEIFAEGTGISTMRELVSKLSPMLPDVPLAIDFEEDLIHLLPCSACENNDAPERFRFRSSLTLGEGRCSKCGVELAGNIRNSIGVDEDLVDKAISSFGFAVKDLVTIRSSSSRIHAAVGGEN
jgi:molybdopterin/thiamine biosynthesis adenylyltransferase